MSEADDSQAQLGSRLLTAGWRQCSLVRPEPSHQDLVPSHLRFDPAYHRLMLVTQSCSVCGTSPDNERYIEVIVVELLAQILPEHGQAAKGAMIRQLVLRVTGLPGTSAIRCDIDRRCFIERSMIPEWVLDELVVDDDALQTFQGWMARYYARAAIPNQLVDRLKVCGFTKAMRKELERRFSKDGSGPRVHEVIERIYIRWEPNKELPLEESYKVWLIMACTEEMRVDLVEERVLRIPNFGNGRLSADGVSIEETQVLWMNNVTLGATKGFLRMGSWDDLSGPDDHAESARSD